MSDEIRVEALRAAAQIHAGQFIGPSDISDREAGIAHLEAIRPVLATANIFVKWLQDELPT